MERCISFFILQKNQRREESGISIFSQTSNAVHFRPTVSLETSLRTFPRSNKLDIQLEFDSPLFCLIRSIKFLVFRQLGDARVFYLSSYPLPGRERRQTDNAQECKMQDEGVQMLNQSEEN